MAQTRNAVLENLESRSLLSAAAVDCAPQPQQQPQPQVALRSVAHFGHGWRHQAMIVQEFIVIDFHHQPHDEPQGEFRRFPHHEGSRSKPRFVPGPDIASDVKIEAPGAPSAPSPITTPPAAENAAVTAEHPPIHVQSHPAVQAPLPVVMVGAPAVKLIAAEHDAAVIGDVQPAHAATGAAIAQAARGLSTIVTPANAGAINFSGLFSSHVMDWNVVAEAMPVASPQEVMTAPVAAAATVVRTVATHLSPKRLFHIASLPNPMQFLSDSINSFVESSAATPDSLGVAPQAHHAVLLTAAVIAADVAILTYYVRNRPRRKQSMAFAGERISIIA
ncbi:MAG TPA: hypothetical protein VF669_01000 [Tepidisphaeraceae bacterium]|jgi:hypothetical protein